MQLRLTCTNYSALQTLMLPSCHLQVLLWHYPDTDRKPLSVETSHQANIFGVRFLHQSGDSKLVTGAMDNSVQLHTLDSSPHVAGSALRPGTPETPNQTVQGVPVHTTVYPCHQGRVKV